MNELTIPRGFDKMGLLMRDLYARQRKSLGKYHMEDYLTFAKPKEVNPLLDKDFWKKYTENDAKIVMQYSVKKNRGGKNGKAAI